jgi:hypothetical protein
MKIEKKVPLPLLKRQKKKKEGKQSILQKSYFFGG